MNKKPLLLLALALLVICLLVAATAGRTLVCEVQADRFSGGTDALEIRYDREGVVKLTDLRAEDGCLRLTFRAVSPGTTFVDLMENGENVWTERRCVHPLGTVTQDTFFGRSTGGAVVPASAAVFLAVWLWLLLRRQRAELRRELYQYGNVTRAGMLVFLCVLLAIQTFRAVRYSGLEDTIRSLLSSAGVLSTFLLPVALVLSVLMTVSGITLMRREGRTWRNMLGCILGVALCLGTIAPWILSEWLQRTSVVDVHNERGFALYAERFVENTVYLIVAYLECILIGTVFVTLRAAKKTPAFDKDYIVIHGCQIRRDGSLTPLLQGRADRALAFAAEQEKAGGRPPVFVASGGQGSDECISEAEAIRRYLLAQGVPPERILLEDRSATTRENIRNSAALIREHAGTDAPRAAFSTTSYHVFRTGLLAAREGFPMEGVGSPTKRYFWINAFIREYVATLVSERKTHLRAIALMIALTLLMVWILYLAVAL